MSNSILTPTAVTREILRVLHEKLSFVGTINRQYDDSFAKSGAKIGDSLKIRLPNRYTVTTGAALNVQDVAEESVTLQVNTQKHVGMKFTSDELTLDLDDFSKRVIQPAVAVLASDIENDALSGLTKKVYNTVGTWGTVPASYKVITDARARMNKFLAPKDNRRGLQLESDAMSSMADALKGLFQDSKEVASQYRDGMIGRHGGFDWYENERVYAHATGTDHTTVTVNDGAIASGDTTITTAGANVTVGTVFTFSQSVVNAVHPETKTDLGFLQQFVITAVDGNDWTFSPAIITSGAKKNVTALPTTGHAITVFGTASQTKNQHLAYHEDAFTFATADLLLPRGVDFAAREVMDGISVRLIRDYDINNDTFPCRVDVLYGYKELRPEHACRITS
jgi:hypothetical protein